MPETSAQPLRVVPPHRLWRSLVIDADAAATAAIRSALRTAGVQVRTATTAVDGLRQAVEHRPDLIVLDVALPDGDGVDLCRRLRAEGVDAHVMIVTGQARVAAKVRGLMAGADDYVLKPFAVAEVMARVAAMLRRRATSAPVHGSRELPDGGQVVHGNLVMDLARHQVRRADVDVHLTRTEFRLLEFILRHPGETLSKERILRAVWAGDFTGDVNIVERYVGYLRAKLDPLGPPLFRTVRFVGYALHAVTARAG